MPNPLRLISEMQTPKPNSIIVCGILVLDEKRAAAKIIIKNIGIAYSKVSAPPWFKAMTLLLAGAATANIRLFVFTCAVLIYNNMLFQLVVVKHFAIRLKELQKGGILERQVYNEISPMVEYKLTVKGQEIVESLIDLLHLDEKMVFKFKGGLIYSAVVGIVVFLLSLVCKYPTNHKHKKKQADLNV